MDFKLLLVLLTAIVCVHVVSSHGSYHWIFREKLHQHRDKEARKSVEKQHTTLLHSVLMPPEFQYVGGPYPDQYFEQPLDHFDAEVMDTYKQRFWVNTDNWNKPSGPVFLYIGGEGGLSSLVVQSGEHVTLAKKYGALIVAVEHRYYGQSINDDGLELDNMQYLSSQQALADLASFHKYASDTYGLGETNKWVCFGGSYPGALSAWFRLKYPHLVYGAIASSAPVKAQLNFKGYDNVVAASLSDPVVNGSTKCALNIKQAFKSVDILLAKEQFEKLATDFVSCKPFSSPPDVYSFASNLADVFMGTVQYNAEMPGFNITNICTVMTQEGDPYDNLIKLNKIFLNRTDTKCGDSSWDNMIKQVSNTTVDRAVPGGVGIRQWLYQTCTQFGYYQTCDSDSSCIFSTAMSLQPNLDLCQQVYKVQPDSVQKRVDFTNMYYGADKPRGTRIVFVNGSIDPWHALSVLSDLSATERAVFINGTAHCANMGNAKPTDPDSLTLARKEIDDQIGQWLTDAAPKVGPKDTKLRFKPQHL